MKAYKMTGDIDMEQNRSVWHMKTKSGPLLHGGGLMVSRRETEDEKRTVCMPMGVSWQTSVEIDTRKT